MRQKAKVILNKTPSPKIKHLQVLFYRVLPKAETKRKTETERKKEIIIFNVRIANIFFVLQNLIPVTGTSEATPPACLIMFPTHYTTGSASLYKNLAFPWPLMPFHVLYHYIAGWELRIDARIKVRIRVGVTLVVRV